MRTLVISMIVFASTLAAAETKLVYCRPGPGTSTHYYFSLDKNTDNNTATFAAPVAKEPAGPGGAALKPGTCGVEDGLLPGATLSVSVRATNSNLNLNSDPGSPGIAGLGAIVQDGKQSVSLGIGNFSQYADTVNSTTPYVMEIEMRPLGSTLPTVVRMGWAGTLKVPEFAVNADRPGNDLGAVPSSTIDGCMVWCRRMPNCVAAVWGEGKCYPKSTLGRQSERPRYTVITYKLK